MAARRPDRRSHRTSTADATSGGSPGAGCGRAVAVRVRPSGRKAYPPYPHRPACPAGAPSGTGRAGRWARSQAARARGPVGSPTYPTAYRPSGLNPWSGSAAGRSSSTSPVGASNVTVRPGGRVCKLPTAPSRATPASPSHGPGTDDPTHFAPSPCGHHPQPRTTDSRRPSGLNTPRTEVTGSGDPGTAAAAPNTRFPEAASQTANSRGAWTCPATVRAYRPARSVAVRTCSGSAGRHRPAQAHSFRLPPRQTETSRGGSARKATATTGWLCPANRPTTAPPGPNRVIAPVPSPAARADPSGPNAAAVTGAFASRGGPGGPGGSSDRPVSASYRATARPATTTSRRPSGLNGRSDRNPASGGSSNRGAAAPTSQTAIWTRGAYGPTLPGTGISSDWTARRRPPGARATRRAARTAAPRGRTRPSGCPRPGC